MGTNPSSEANTQSEHQSHQQQFRIAGEYSSNPSYVRKPSLQHQPSKLEQSSPSQLLQSQRPRESEVSINKSSNLPDTSASEDIRMTQSEYRKQPIQQSEYHQERREYPPGYKPMDTYSSWYHKSKAIYKSRHQVKTHALVQKLQNAVSQDPTNSNTHFNLAMEYEHMQNFKQAIHHYEKVVQLNPQKYQAHYSLAEIYLYEIENPQLARDHLHEGLKSKLLGDEERVQMLMMLGSIYENENDTENARKEYRKVLQIRPDHEMAGNRLALIKPRRSKMILQ